MLQRAAVRLREKRDAHCTLMLRIEYGRIRLHLGVGAGALHLVRRDCWGNQAVAGIDSAEQLLAFRGKSV